MKKNVTFKNDSKNAVVNKSENRIYYKKLEGRQEAISRRAFPKNEQIYSNHLNSLYEFVNP